MATPANQITDAYVQQFSDNFYTVSQQKKSRLEPYVRIKDGIVGASTTVDRIGATTAKKRTSRNADTPLIKTPFDRRVMLLGDYEWADLLDDQDKIRLLTDPASDVMAAGISALLSVGNTVLNEDNNMSSRDFLTFLEPSGLPPFSRPMFPMSGFPRAMCLIIFQLFFFAEYIIDLFID